MEHPKLGAGRYLTLHQKQPVNSPKDPRNIQDDETFIISEVFSETQRLYQIGSIFFWVHSRFTSILHRDEHGRSFKSFRRALGAVLSRGFVNQGRGRQQKQEESYHFGIRSSHHIVWGNS